jgi:hypothetical protein
MYTVKIAKIQNYKVQYCSFRVVFKEVFRTCNVLPFSCTHLALWRGKAR